MIRKIGFIGGFIGSFIINKDCSAAESDLQFSRNATCIIKPIPGSQVKGLVSFRQSSVTSPVQIASSLRGLLPGHSYSICIHQSGEITKGEEQLGDPYPK